MSPDSGDSRAVLGTTEPTAGFLVLGPTLNCCLRRSFLFIGDMRGPSWPKTKLKLRPDQRVSTNNANKCFLYRNAFLRSKKTGQDGQDTLFAPNE